METTFPTISENLLKEAEFYARLDLFVAGAQAKIDAYMKAEFPTLSPEKLFIDAGEKLVRIWKRSDHEASEGRRGSCWAFVAIVDNETKALGYVKRGDILKPATWKAPAKHARGNIFAVDNGLTNVGPYGPAYMK